MHNGQKAKPARAIYCNKGEPLPAVKIIQKILYPTLITVFGNNYSNLNRQIVPILCLKLIENTDE